MSCHCTAAEDEAIYERVGCVLLDCMRMRPSREAEALHNVFYLRLFPGAAAVAIDAKWRMAMPFDASGVAFGSAFGGIASGDHRVAVRVAACDGVIQKPIYRLRNDVFCRFGLRDLSLWSVNTTL